MIIAKEHRINGRKLLGVCDGDLLGKRFEEKGLQLDLSGEFYRGEEADEKKLKEMVNQASSANFVGRQAVDFAIRNGVINEEKVKKVSGIPHAQSFEI